MGLTSSLNKAVAEASKRKKACEAKGGVWTKTGDMSKNPWRSASGNFFYCKPKAAPKPKPAAKTKPAAKPKPEPKTEPTPEPERQPPAVVTPLPAKEKSNLPLFLILGGAGVAAVMLMK